MSESILRLRVQSDEYDNKIKRAAEGIQQYAQKCREAGGTLSFLDDGVLEFVQSLGQMDTVAKGSRQQMRELSNALTTLTTTYRGLTEEEKNSPFGVELARGIDALTERAGEARDAMSDVEQSIKNASSDTRTFDQLAQGMSVATAGFQGLTGAGKLLGIEMGNDVEVIAKLQAAMAVTNSLTTIQNALQKQSALMQGLNAAKTALASAAQTAYAVATGEATVAQTAFNIAASANPYGLLLAGIGVLVSSIAAFAMNTGESTDALEGQKKVIDDITRSVDAAAESYKRLAEQMKSLGIGGKKEYNALIQAKQDQFQNVRNAWLSVGFDKKKEEERNGRDTEKWKALDEEQKKLHAEMLKVKKEYEELQRANKERVKRINEYARGNFNFTTESEVQSAIDFIKNQLKYKDPTSKDYGVLSKRLSELENIWLPQFQDKTTNNVNQKTITPTKSLKEEKDDFVEINGLIAQAEEHISNLQQLIKEAPDETTISTLKHQLVEAQDELKRLNNIGSEVSNAALPPLVQMEAVLKKLNEDLKNAETPEAYQNLLADIKAINEEIDTFTGRKRDKKDKKKDDKSFEKEYSKIVGGVSSIASGIQQMGVEMPQELQSILGVLTGISSIMTGITALLTLIQIDTKATAISSTADAIIPLARGGVVHAAGGFMVPGNNFSGDLVPAYLNSGEMVLNRFQQQALAGTLENGGMKNISISGHLEGETIALSVDRWGKRSGRGELAFWKNQ